MKLVRISIAKQSLVLVDNDEVKFKASISTGKKGSGEVNGSERTPRGWHLIRAKIGHGCELNTVFIGRRPSGEIYDDQLKNSYPERDWILTRILWLSGMEPGFNRLGKVDTMRRYIYIHGCPDHDRLGRPGSLSRLFSDRVCAAPCACRRHLSETTPLVLN